MNQRAEAAMEDRLLVRVLSEEKQLVRDAARRQGVTISDFVRDAVASAAGVTGQRAAA